MTSEEEQGPFAGDDTLVLLLRGEGLCVRDSSWVNDACASVEVYRPGPTCTSDPFVVAQVFIDALDRRKRECKGERYAVWAGDEHGVVEAIDAADAAPACVTDDRDAVLAVVRSLWASSLARR